jgi:hypothetical protein
MPPERRKKKTNPKCNFNLLKNGNLKDLRLITLMSEVLNDRNDLGYTYLHRYGGA